MTTPTPLRMSAYYFEFQPTGVPEIDLILSAVAQASSLGRWYEGGRTVPAPHTGATPVEWIQNAANAAAARCRSSAKALEFAEYLAKSAEAFMDACGTRDNALQAIEEGADFHKIGERADEAYVDHWASLKNRTYEFRKRADKAQRAPATQDSLSPARVVFGESLSAECCWPEDLQTYAERSAYQRGVGDARRLARQAPVVAPPELPPLPEPAFSVPTCGVRVRAFTGGQTQAYARQAVAEALARRDGK